MKNILVPVDFSAQAGYALDLALQLKAHKAYKITLINVIEMPMGGLIDTSGVTLPPAYHPEFLEQLMSKNKEHMNKFLVEHSLKPNQVEIIFEIGNTFVCIDETLKKNKYDLVIMGTKGVTGIREMVVGSNTEKVVRTAYCPVIAVHNKVDLEKIKHIAFATKGDELSENLIMHVKQLQETFKATLHVVRINTPNNFERDLVAKYRLQEFADKYMLKNYTINIFNDLYEEQGILSFANQLGADIIAMGTHGRKGVGHLIYGSVAEDVVNHASKLIWTYHIKKE